MNQQTFLLQLTKVGFKLSGQPIFNALDLEVCSGECVAVLGNSGSGKSTLLHLIAHPDRCLHDGTIDLDRVETAFLYQEDGLLHDMSVAGNLRLVQRFRSTSDPQQVEDLLLHLNLDRSLHQSPVTLLSGGERRRVAIARALAYGPRLLVFDEPDSGLDINNIREFALLIRRLVNEGHGIMVTTHNPSFCAQAADRVFYLSDGVLTEITVDDHSATAVRRDQIESKLIDLPPKRVITLGEKKKRQRWPVYELVRATSAYFANLFPITPSAFDYFRVAGRSIYSSLMTGALFYLLVGAMLGATTIAVVKTLTGSAIADRYAGLLKYVLTPKLVLQIINGSYIVFLAPAVSAILFAARAGSIMTGWLGAQVVGGQVRALRGVGVDPDRYFRSPVIMAMLFSYFGTVALFTFGMWQGSVLTTTYLLELDRASQLLQIPSQIWVQSYMYEKTMLYSVYLSFIISGLGLAEKRTHGEIALHTTKAITYTTAVVAITELLFAFYIPWA